MQQSLIHNLVQLNNLVRQSLVTPTEFDIAWSYMCMDMHAYKKQVSITVIIQNIVYRGNTIKSISNTF